MLIEYVVTHKHYETYLCLTKFTFNTDYII